MERTLNLAAVHEAMTAKGLSQANVAKRLAVSREIVSQWLKAAKMPKPDKLLRLGLLLGLSFNRLVQASAAANEPVVAYRRKARRETTVAHLAQARATGHLLERLVRYLPVAQRLQKPPALKSPRLDYEYVQEVVAGVRRELGVGPTESLTWQTLVRHFQRLDVTLIPVLWGQQEHHGNALHIYLPESMTTWVFLNLDSNQLDFKFWLAHELGHSCTPDVKEADFWEDFADQFAEALLFPEPAARVAYEGLSRLPTPGGRVNRLKEIAGEQTISLVTVHCAVKRYAAAHGLPSLGLVERALFGAATNLAKGYPTVACEQWGGHVPSPQQYLEFAKGRFGSRFFDLVTEYLHQEGQNPAFIQSLLQVPLQDAKGLCGELA